MSDLAAKIAATTPIAEGVRNRILILDVERLDGITQQHWWEAGDLHRKKRHIRADTVIREPRTTIFGWKWYHEPDAHTICEWDKGGRNAMLRKAHALMSEADILVGHYITGADIPWLRGDFHFPRIGAPGKFQRLPDLPPFKPVDTYKHLATYKSGVPFKGLDAALKLLGHPGKTDYYDPAAMERAVTGSVEDQEREAAYCRGDVVGTQFLLDYLRPNMKNHPALFVEGEDKLTTCNRCGGKTKDTARRYVANVLSYSMRKCSVCSAYSRLSLDPQRMSIIRGV
jgi:hypothetical protein